MLISELPAHAKSIHRSAALGTGVFYVVPAGQTLYITSAYVSMIPNSGTGSNMGITVGSEDTGALQNLLIVATPVGASQSVFKRLDGIARRCEGGYQVAITDLGPATSLVVGFAGWLY